METSQLRRYLLEHWERIKEQTARRSGATLRRSTVQSQGDQPIAYFRRMGLLLLTEEVAKPTALRAEKSL